MLAVTNYQMVIEQLVQAFGKRYKMRFSAQSFVRPVGLFFARPGQPFAEKNLLPQVAYFDANSGDDIDFFCVGYTPFPFDKGIRPGEAVTKSTDSWWEFSETAFTAFKNALEAEQRWKYSGSCDLLLLNAWYDQGNRQAELGFESMLSIDVENAVKHERVGSLERLLEVIVDIVRNKDLGDNPVGAMSNQLGTVLLRSDIWSVVWNVVPLGLGQRAEKYAHFAVRLDSSPR